MPFPLYAMLRSRFGTTPRSLVSHERLEEDFLLTQPPKRQPFELPANCLNLLKKQRVAVVGGGLAGLMAARRLGQHGIDVTVYEARWQLGGRVLSNTTFSNGRVIDEGAELIGSFHTQWLELARSYGLSLISRMDAHYYQQYLGLDINIRLGRKLSQQEIRDLLVAMDNRFLIPLSQQASQIKNESDPWNDSRLTTQDNMSVAEALDKIYKVRRDELLWKMIELLLVNNEVAPLEEMNYLGLLCKVKGAQMGPDSAYDNSFDRLMGYWGKLEIFRSGEGCQKLALEIAKEIREKYKGKVLLSRAVTHINLTKQVVVLASKEVVKRDGTLSDNPPIILPYEYVVFAIPPSVWDGVTISVDGKAVSLKNEIGLMGMGPAVKFFSDVKKRFWIGENAAPLGGSSELGQVWEGTDNQTQNGKQGIVLSVFSGPTVADPKGRRVPKRGELENRLRELYPGYTENLNKTLFSDWLNVPFVKTGYASPRKNEIFTIGRKLNEPFRERMFFAGEHTQMDFFGYMEGALRSGERAAEQLMMQSCGLQKQPAPDIPSPRVQIAAAPIRETPALAPDREILTKPPSSSDHAGAAESPFLQQELLNKSEDELESRAAALMAESPFMNALEVDYSSETTTDSPVPQSVAGDLLNPATSEEQNYFAQFNLEDERASLEDVDEEPDEEWSGVEFDLPADASPLDALSPSELKAVRITSTFETGRAGSFGGLTGNFDGQGVSFGLMNFAWKAGSLITLLKEFLHAHPATFAGVFGPDATRFQEMLLATKPDPKNPKRRVRDLDRQMEFARNVLNDANNKIREPWRGYFKQLEANPDFRRIQVKAVRKAAERARYWCRYFDLKTERSFAFMFDLVSSHGGAWLNADKYKGKRRELLRAMLEDKKAQVGRAELTETEKLEVIANMIADVSLEKWRKQVRARKLWFVRGSGDVHGTVWNLAGDFGVTDDPPNFEREEPEQRLLDDNYETDTFERWPRSGEAQEELEESEEFSASDGETLYFEENGKREQQPETLECSPSADEAQQEEFEKLESDLIDLHPDEEATGIEFEDRDSELPEGVAYDARIVNNKDRTERTPAEVALIVDRWETAESAKVSGARLKVYECDTGERGRSDALTAGDVQIAEFTLDLSPNPEFVSNPTKAGVPHVVVSNAKWANAALEKKYKATTKPDMILWLGKRSLPLWIPREDILEEGSTAEIGFVIEDRAGRKVERISIAQGHVAGVSLPDYLKLMLEIPGRFDDPQRDAAIEMDGTKFDEFLNGRNRREFIGKWLDEHPALTEAANEPNASLKTGDIVKAWFIVHDVSAGATLGDKRFKASDPDTKAGAVHGFLNRAGYYAATHDFNTDRAGTVYEFLSKRGRKIAGGLTINIETVPDIQKGVRDKPDGSHGDPSNADLYASIGYIRVNGKKVDYYKWTKAAFDVLADLYIFASARARHLLTITAHKEVDRNLARSVIWREYSAAEMRSGTGKAWKTAREKPSNYHGDPYGFNMQALYDLITQKLNALGGKQMPVGARYGIHPRRVSKADGENVINGDIHRHEFPHQSDPKIENDTGLKAEGWWNS